MKNPENTKMGRTIELSAETLDKVIGGMQEPVEPDPHVFSIAETIGDMRATGISLPQTAIGNSHSETPACAQPLPDETDPK